VPLIEGAERALAACEPQGEYALSTDGGETHIAAITLSGWAAGTAKEVVDDFQAKRIRSGVETLLASASVSQDTRGRLQSHGISGVQARHYDGHDYLAEKRMALEKLYNLLEARSANDIASIGKSDHRRRESGSDSCHLPAEGKEGGRAAAQGGGGRLR
jgi:hypothetical protein